MIEHNFEVRKALYKQIEKERGSKVINYATGDRPGLPKPISLDVTDLFVKHLGEIWLAKKLTLILYTAGGDINTAWHLIKMLRISREELEIVVISKALSAGTLMCLGADKIVMTKQAVLGPIDPSVENNPLNHQAPGELKDRSPFPVSVEDVQGYLDFARKTLGIKGSNSLTQVLTNLSAQVQPLVLGNVFRIREQVCSQAEELLDHQKTKNGKRIESGKKKNIVSFLCGGCGSHDRTINCREAKDLGLVVEEPSKEFCQILEKLQSSIDDTLQLRSVFSHDAELKGREEATYSLHQAMIESADYGCHHYVSEGKLKKVVYAQKPDNQPKTTILCGTTFEGWRKEKMADGDRKAEE